MATTETSKKSALAGVVAAALFLSGCSFQLGGPGLGQAGNQAGSPLTGPLTGSLPLGGQAAPGPAGPAAPGTTTASGGTVGARIKEAAENLPDPFPYAPGTQNGNLGCADVVSTALENAGVMNRGEHQLAVRGVMGLLERKGWNAVNPPPFADGDVICWDPLPGGKHMHIGIIVIENGQPYAINNSSGQRRVVKVPLSSMNRGINKIYRNPEGGANS